MAKLLLGNGRRRADGSSEPRPVPWLPWGVSFAVAALVFLAPLPLAALAALGSIVLAARAPLPSLCLVVISLPFYLLPRTVGRYEFSPTEILIVISTMGALVRLAGNTLGNW